MYKVLIVEDEVLVRVGLKSTLAQEGPDFYGWWARPPTA